MISKLIYINEEGKQIVLTTGIDNEDIESLGWDQKHYDVFAFGNIEMELSGGVKIDKNKRIISNMCIIYDSNGRLFVGQIKNKSELKRLMNQLNITHE